MLNSSSSADHTPESWAEIRAHDRVTRYRRRGSGRTVLLLATRSEGPLWTLLLEALGAHYRMIVPDLAEQDAELPVRLAEFLEGIGCPTVSVIGDERFASAALELAMAGCDQIARVVFVADETPEPLVRSRLPLLVVRAQQDAELTVSLVREFLETAPAGWQPPSAG